MNSVIIGAVDGYNWKQIELWWKSIKIAEYTGEIHLLTYDIDNDTLAQLGDHGIYIHPCEKQHGQVVIDRFKDLAVLAQKFDTDTWCICTDVGDLVMQLDPDPFLEDLEYQNYDTVIASEGILHKGNAWVRHNAVASFPSLWNRIANRPLYNAGCFASRAQVLERVAKNVFDLCMTTPQSKNHDQLALNIILQLDAEFSNWTCFEKAMGTWCFSGASSIFAKAADRENYHEDYPILKDGQCFNSAEVLHYFFHHWNRNADVMKEVIERIDNASVKP